MLLSLGGKIHASYWATIPLIAASALVGAGLGRLLHRWRRLTAVEVDASAVTFTGSSGRRLSMPVERFTRSAQRRVVFASFRSGEPLVSRSYYLIGTASEWVWAFDVDEWSESDVAKLARRLGLPFKPAANAESLDFAQLGRRFPGVAEWWRAPASFQLSVLLIFSAMAAFVGLLLVFGAAAFAR